jgi:hypothetical protein
MEANIQVTLVTAIWKEPRVFAGVFEIAPAGEPPRARYGFRAEASDGEYRFTRLERLDALKATPTSTVALEALTFALDGAVNLLHARDLDRFKQGRGGPQPPCSLDDLGFSVRFPFAPADAEARAALAALLGSAADEPSLAADA